MTTFHARPTFTVSHTPPLSSALEKRWTIPTCASSGARANDSNVSFRASSSSPRARRRQTSPSAGRSKYCQPSPTPPCSLSQMHASTGRPGSPSCAVQPPQHADEPERAGGEERRAHDEVVVRFLAPAGPLAHALDVRDDADEPVEEVERRQRGEERARGFLRCDAGHARRGQRGREEERCPHPLVAERAFVVLEVDLGAERRHGQRGRRSEQLLHASFADVPECAPDHAAYLCASACLSVRPWPARERSGTRAPSTGSSTPSKSIDSIRTWSWKYSR